MKLLSLILLSVTLLLGCDKKDSSSDPAPAETEATEETQEGLFDDLTNPDEPAGELEELTGPLSDHGVFSASITWDAPLVSGRIGNTIKLTLTDNGQPLVGAKVVSVKPYSPKYDQYSDRQNMEIEKIPGSENEWTISGVIFEWGGAAGEWQIIVSAEVENFTDVARIVINEPIN